MLFCPHRFGCHSCARRWSTRDTFAGRCRGAACCRPFLPAARSRSFPSSLMCGRASSSCSLTGMPSSPTALCGAAADTGSLRATDGSAPIRRWIPPWPWGGYRRPTMEGSAAGPGGSPGWRPPSGWLVSICLARHARPGTRYAGSCRSAAGSEGRENRTFRSPPTPHLDIAAELPVSSWLRPLAQRFFPFPRAGDAARIVEVTQDPSQSDTDQRRVHHCGAPAAESGITCRPGGPRRPPAAIILTAGNARHRCWIG